MCAQTGLEKQLGISCRVNMWCLRQHRISLVCGIAVSVFHSSGEGGAFFVKGTVPSVGFVTWKVDFFRRIQYNLY